MGVRFSAQTPTDWVGPADSVCELISAKFERNNTVYPFNPRTIISIHSFICSFGHAVRGYTTVTYCTLHTGVCEFLKNGSALNNAMLSSVLCFQQCTIVQFSTEQRASVSPSFEAGYQLGGVHRTTCYLGRHTRQHMVHFSQECPRPIKPAVWNLCLSRGSKNNKALSQKFHHALLACHTQWGWLSAYSALQQKRLQSRVRKRRKSLKQGNQ